MYGMLSAQKRFLPLCQALSDVGRPTLPGIAIRPLPDGFPLPRCLHLIPNIDADISGTPGIAAHGHRASGADDLNRPVIALCSIDEASLDHRVHGVAVIEDQTRVIISFDGNGLSINDPLSNHRASHRYDTLRRAQYPGQQSEVIDSQIKEAPTSLLVKPGAPSPGGTTPAKDSVSPIASSQGASRDQLRHGLNGRRNGTPPAPH